MLNHIVLMGRIVRKPEVKNLQDNLSVARYTVAVERDSTGKQTEKVTEPADKPESGQDVTETSVSGENINTNKQGFPWIIIVIIVIAAAVAAALSVVAQKKNKGTRRKR